MSASDPNPPELTITLSIDPPSFALNEAQSPTITITAVSHATKPITIFTRNSIFNLNLAQQRHNFTCNDLTSNTIVETDVTTGPCRRRPFSRRKNGPDDKWFITLKPEEPMVFKNVFQLAKRLGAPTQGHDGPRYRVLEEGHRYRYAIKQGDQISQWWYGTRKDVLVGAGKPQGLQEASGPPIEVDTAAPVEFEVVELDDVALEKKSQRPVVKPPRRSRCTFGVM